MSQFWNQLKDRVQARGAQANSTIGIIGGADGPTAVFVSTKPDSWLGTLLGLLPWGTGIISAGLLLGWCHKDKKRLLLPMILLPLAAPLGRSRLLFKQRQCGRRPGICRRSPCPVPCCAQRRPTRSAPGCGSARPRWYGLWRCCSAAAHPELHPCAAPYNKSRSIPAKRLWKHSGYFLKKRLITTNRCNGFNGAAHPLLREQALGRPVCFCVRDTMNINLCL